MKDRAPRRIEEGVPKMDRDVAVSFGTAQWKLMGKAIAEAIASLEDRDPFVASWAMAAARGEKSGATTLPGQPAQPSGPPSDRVKVERIATAVGKTVKVASGAVLSDSAASVAAGAQSTTARTIIELGQGSRSWLAYRALLRDRDPGRDHRRRA